jgi:phage N-6-adenine-methyltransferase
MAKSVADNGKNQQKTKSSNSRSIGSAAKSVNGRSKSDSNAHHILLEAVCAARQSAGWTQSELGRRANLKAQAIARLEKGTGSVANFGAVMTQLGIELTGIGPGKTLPDQLRGNLAKRSMSLDDLAARTGLARNTIANLVEGVGTIASLLRLLDVIAPKARRKVAKQSSMDPLDRADPDSRFTPPEFMAEIYAAFGPIDLDPCANHQSKVKAARKIYFSEGGDGLKENWTGNFVFVNPPFSNITTWLKRAHDQWKAGHAKTIAFLAPTRIDTTYFHEVVIAGPQTKAFVRRGRVSFAMPSGKKQSNSQPLLLIVFGSTKEQRRRYDELAPGFWMERENYET